MKALCFLLSIALLVCTIICFALAIIHISDKMLVSAALSFLTAIIFFAFGIIEERNEEIARLRKTTLKNWPNKHISLL